MATDKDLSPLVRYSLNGLTVLLVGLTIYIRCQRNADLPLIPEPRLVQNGKARLNLPKGWIMDREAGHDHDRVYAPRKVDARALRISFIVFPAKRKLNEAELKSFVSESTKMLPSGAVERISADRYLLRGNQTFDEQGDKGRQEGWFVAQAFGDGVRACLFTYTMRHGEELERRTKEEVAFLDQSIRAIEFVRP